MEFSVKGKVFNVVSNILLYTLYVNGILDLISNWVEDINIKGNEEDIIWDMTFDVIIVVLIERLVDIIVIGINVVGIDESGKNDIFVVCIVDIKVVFIGDKIVVVIVDIVGIVDIIVEYKFDNIVVGISDIIVFDNLDNIDECIVDTIVVIIEVGIIDDIVFNIVVGSVVSLVIIVDGIVVIIGILFIIIVGIFDIIVFGIVDIVVGNIEDKVDWNIEFDWIASIGYIVEGIKESGK